MLRGLAKGSTRIRPRYGYVSVTVCTNSIASALPCCPPVHSRMPALVLVHTEAHLQVDHYRHTQRANEIAFTFAAVPVCKTEK